MKINYKIYQTLQNAVEVQNLGEKVVEIHYMNDTPYLARFAGSGQFSAWASDGKNYKLLIEKGYYEALKPFFSARVNNVWLKLYDIIGKARRNMLFKLVLPVLFLFVILIILGASIPEMKQFQNFILIGSLVGVLAVNILQSSFIKKKVNQERDKAIIEIKRMLGRETFEDLLKKQRDYHESYFDFDDEPALEADVVDQEEAKKDEPLELDKPEEKEAKVDLESLKVVELRELAKKAKIANYHSLKKAELIEALKQEK